jgi:3-oxoacyl-[acyl-carrier protein] reductase
LAKLLAFSIIRVLPPPFKTVYAGGIAESESRERVPVRIESEYFSHLKIGLIGEVVEKKTDFGELNYFVPTLPQETRRKVALVTGGTRGIGKATALELARRGFDIAITDVELPDDGKQLLEEIKGLGMKAKFVNSDVSRFEEVERIVSQIVSELGRIDVLVNNAGINLDKLLVDMTPESWQKVIDVDLTGVFNCTKAVLPLMIAQGGGRIVNLSSMSALDGAVGQANYAAAKGGIISFTKNVARENAQHNILCNAVAPGCIRTRMTDAMPPGMLKERVAAIPLGRRGEPEEVAKLVAFLVTEGSYITGQLININAGEYI